MNAPAKITTLLAVIIYSHVPLLTIAICTYDRSTLLSECLQSIYVQEGEDVEVIVVSNHPSPSKLADVQEITSLYKGCKLLHEGNVGLSHARNLALKHCHTKYIAYVDDDARLNVNYLSTAKNLLKEHSMICLGGHIQSWWYYGRSNWLAEDWGQKPLLAEHLQILKDDQYLWGSNIIVDTQCLKEVGGFPLKRGMIGTKLGYGAENLMQIELRSRGHAIFYTPTLIVDHVITAEKLHLSWHLKSIVRTYNDGRDIFPEQYRLSYRIRKYIRWPVKLVSSTHKWMFQQGYFWQNWVLDIYKALF